jgi:hypothetical protein
MTGRETGGAVAVRRITGLVGVGGGVEVGVIVAVLVGVASLSAATVAATRVSTSTSSFGATSTRLVIPIVHEASHRHSSEIKVNLRI